MAVARRGSGPLATVRALASQIHPVFMLPAVASSFYGAVVVGSVAPLPAALHALATFFGLYTAHVKDGYVDFYLRDEDDDHPLTERGCRLVLAGSVLTFLGLTAALGVVAGPLAAAVTLPGILVGYLHAPQFDMNPVTATVGYPSGIGLAVVGGAVVQAGSLPPTAAAYAVVFTVILIGIKAIDDATDVAYDASIGKHTMAVVLGQQRTRYAAYGIQAVGLVLVLALTALAVFPPSAVLAVLVFGVVAALTYRADAKRATEILIRGSYLFVAVLVAAEWFQPLA